MPEASEPMPESPDFKPIKKAKPAKPASEFPGGVYPTVIDFGPLDELSPEEILRQCDEYLTNPHSHEEAMENIFGRR